MEKLFFLKTKQLTNTGIMCAAALCAPIISSDLFAQDVLQKELTRRISDSKTAQDLLFSGDKAYNKQDYEVAVKDYAEAFRLLPNGTLNAELRVAAADRYATAATERSRRLVKFGHYDEARALLEGVLKPEVAPGHLGAMRLNQQLDDPIRYNPALTPEHVTDVVKVGQLLREGEGFYSLGQYDRAEESYYDVLRLDPYNKAARRSLEKINAAQSDYQRAARDQARASMLNDVDRQWELSALSSDVALPAEYSLEPGSVASSVQTKLSNIIVENVSLDQVGIEEALNFIRVQSRIGDLPNAGGQQDGINIVLNLGLGDTPVAKAVKSAKVNIQATNLPISAILDYITEQTGTKWRNDGVAVTVSSLEGASSEMISKTFRVPPTFLSGTSSSSSDSAESIFGSDNDNTEGKLAERISAKDYLMKNGIPFPDGATAKYLSSINSLIVKNTAKNIEAIEQIVSIVAGAEPIQIVTRTTIIRISETELKELGFDWLISPIDLGSALLGGGTTGTGSIINALSGTASTSAPVTAGLRSGTATQGLNSIDSFLNATNSGSINTQSRAPGILSLTHVIGGAQIQVIMRGLDQSKSADIMVQPSVVSSIGHRARVESSRDIIYPTEYEPPEMPSSSSGSDIVVTPSHPTAFTTRKVGVSLEVEATVDDNKNYINLALLPELVEFEGFVNYGSPINGTSNSSFTFNFTNLLAPIFTSTAGNFGEITPNDILMPVFKTITTGNISTTVQDGATIVLAGLVTSKKIKTEDKIPLLGDIPVAGRLFRNEATSTFNEAIIILVNSEIIDPTGKPWRNR